MAQAPGWQQDPTRVRALVTAGGLVILLALAAVLWARRVDPVEVGATLLFIPLFLMVVLWRLPGGIIGGVAAAAAYTAMRWPAIEAVGLDAYAGLIAGRGLAYIAFGVIGGWAIARLQQSLTKLDLYDQIDDDTGLFNARFLVDDIELERSRSQRYQTLFSIVVLDVPDSAFEPLSTRKRRKALRTLGGHVQNSIRRVDRGVHAVDGTRHRLALILPETPTEGAEVFAARFLTAFAGAMAEQGAPVEEEALTVTSYTIPGDEDGVDVLRQQFAALIPK